MHSYHDTNANAESSLMQLYKLRRRDAHIFCIYPQKNKHYYK